MAKNRVNVDKHKRILTELLLDILKSLDGKIVFKGGTAAMLFYELPRLSLDLDFDIVKEFNSEDIDRIKIIIQKYGRIKDFYNKRYTIFFMLDYEQNTPNIKIEFNKRKWENNNYEIHRLLGVELKIADIPTMMTHKAIAITERKLPVARDLFDIYYFLKREYFINSELLKERINKSPEEYFSLLIKFIKKNYNSKNVLQGVGELVDEKQKSWLRKNLVSESIKEIEKYLQSNCYRGRTNR
ncbi:MAG: nucleotidyl transferase AbiEii/AbiGii toxin family protein [Candidatus Pacebacteria bacterium]|jgi:predicted nucleotidyltransferase component of viral defense system|nr:nucleotidyl transferase AbiEii/AbiGii toxin family protein [Candidatus Paceibacterota bacterium]MDD4994836.1 nucleotidyl transferase AbiEii/AbiGii toxin family protein [Candidatus Paceibacterota bacterium]MDD5535537.1 nucleotidyl transferase AbiEii/AbiGii toxin family protein [Candidatus Paceibacterota bacterium]